KTNATPAQASAAPQGLRHLEAHPERAHRALHSRCATGGLPVPSPSPFPTVPAFWGERCFVGREGGLSPPSCPRIPAMPAPAACPYPVWIGARGGGKRAPENTLAAFREGAARGFRMFECDVKLSADEVPFLLHDSDLERTSSGMGRAGDHPWSALSRLDAGAWHSAPYAGEPLPTLEAIARWVLANGCAINLEIKPTPGTEARTGQAVARAAAGLWSASLPAPLLSSFSVPALAAAAAAAPALPRALLLDELWDGWFETAETL